MTVVTAIADDGQPEGMVVGSFTSVSLDPPLVAFLPSASSRSWARLRGAGRFCVNILGAEQEHLCRQFAVSGGDKYDGVGWRAAPSGSPVLDGAVAWIDCETDTIHRAGDHDIVIGRVLDLDTAAENLPLLFFQGGYGSFTPHLLTASDDRFREQLDLIDRARPLLEGTARSTSGQIAVAGCDGKTLTVLATAGQTGDDHVARATIGESVPLNAPIGIWWMAYAAPDTAEEWLGGIDDKGQREKVREALRLIRADGGLTVGLASVHEGLGELLAERTSGRKRTPAEEAAALSHLVQRPLDFVASRFAVDESAADHPEVGSIWSPVLDGEGRVALGVLATGFPSDHSLGDVTRAVRHLADGIGALARATTRGDRQGSADAASTEGAS
ncbi:flavin reductase family protein [Streptomyces sp. NPDC049954]|uniref:flavin reductase family protein n=1 Tax=Streptomyces sp. NPDC049954 TaxID=3155779 RepID=UPI003412EADC